MDTPYAKVSRKIEIRRIAMIERAVAAEFIRSADAGRTSPAILTCESNPNKELELFCKFSIDCEEGVVHLAREVVAACLAADLGLPVPRPYLVELTSEFIQSVSDNEVRTRMQNSSPVCFGSTKVPTQFSAWSKENNVTSAMQPVAASVLMFDGIVQNSDRRETNPNCLTRGEEIRIIDHELCFANKLVLGWRPPWVDGGLEFLRGVGNHIFYRELQGALIDFSPARSAWAGLSDQRIDGYVTAVPREWAAAGEDVQAAVDLVRGARDHIDECVAEIRRVLT